MKARALRRGDDKNGTVLGLASKSRKRIAGHIEGWLCGTDGDHVLIDFEGNAHGPLRARSTVARKTLLSLSNAERPAVLLVFEREVPTLPIIVGVLQSNLDRPAEALVDGERVVLTAAKEIVLQCGKASITLRSNGRVSIRGAYVETRAQGVNRIKGGSVQIN